MSTQSLASAVATKLCEEYGSIVMLVDDELLYFKVVVPEQGNVIDGNGLGKVYPTIVSVPL